MAPRSFAEVEEKKGGNSSQRSEVPIFLPTAILIAPGRWSQKATQSAAPDRGAPGQIFIKPKLFTKLAWPRRFPGLADVRAENALAV